MPSQHPGVPTKVLKSGSVWINKEHCHWVIGVTWVVLLAGKYNATVSEHNFSLDKVVHAEAMKASKEAKSAEKHHSRACGMSSTEMARSDVTNFC